MQAPPPPPARPGPSPGKIVAIVLGVVFGTLILCCGGLLLTGRNVWQSGLAADKEAKAFATQAMRAVGEDWDVSELERRASRDFQASVKSRDTEKLMRTFRRKLGPLKSLDEFTTTNYNAHSGTGGTRIAIDMNAPAKFEKGSGKILLTVVKQDGRWGIQSLRVNSPALSE